MSKVCIIGGSGFLGSHVSDELTKSNHEVTIFDNQKSKWLKKGQKLILGRFNKKFESKNIKKNDFIEGEFEDIEDDNDRKI